MGILREIVRARYYGQVRVLSDQFAYGMREVLLLCNDLDRTGIINGVTLHGDFSNVRRSDWANARDGIGRKKPILFWSEVQREKLKANGISVKNGITIGSPFCHLYRFINNKGIFSSVEDKLAGVGDVLFFPAHSHFGLHAELSSAKDIVEFAGNREVTVCLFWTEFINPRVLKTYLNLGFKVFCVGYRGNQVSESPWGEEGGRITFLWELFKLISRSSMVVTSTPDTSFWYSVYLKRKTAFLSSSVSVRSYMDRNLNPGLIKQRNWDFDYELEERTVYDPNDGGNQLHELSRNLLGDSSCSNFLNWVKTEKKALISASLPSRLVDILEYSILSDFNTGNY